MKQVFALIVAALLMVGISQTAGAQTGNVTNPTTVQFTASPDHATVVNGTPVVSNYQLDVMTSTATSVLAFTFPMGKPTPDGANTIAALVPQLSTLVNGMYFATVTANGPGGSGKSTPSAPFGRIGPARAPTAVTAIVR